MEKAKEFIKNHKKVVILAAILLVIVIAAGIAAGIYFSAQSASDTASDGTQTEQQADQQKEEKKTSKPAEKNDKEDSKSSSSSKENDAGDKEKTESSSDSSASAENNASSQGSSNSNNGAGGSNTGTGNPSANSPGSAGASGSNQGSGTSNSVCSHEWVTRTETVQEPVTIIVTSEQREYTLYRIFWYNTETWEETRDSSRFDEWYHSADGALYPLYNPYDKPEDNPLFQGYDGNGNPTYTGDHSIVSGLIEEVPCEPYEKTEMTTVTRTVTVCAKCGATQ